MEKTNSRKKSLLIICNILLTLLLILTTAVTITLAVQQFNMNIGGNITFNATDVQATISAGQVANGSVADSANKMHEITITPENDGATEKATWENLEITFDGLDDVIISFTVTNNHTESNLKMSLKTSSINAENMTISTKIDNSNKTSVVIPKQAEGNDNKVDCQIIFHVESNLTSANIEGFSIEYTFANTDEEPTYAVAIDPSVSSMVTGVSLDSAEKGEQVTVTANIQDTVTEDYVIMSDGLYYIENGSEEKVTINQTEGQYSFTMPANDITIGVEKYRRLDDFTFEGNAITGYTGSATELTLPSHYETVSINSQDYTVEKNTGTQITEIGMAAFSGYYNLTTITIPSSVVGISDYAFADCSSLAIVYNNSSLNIISGDSNHGRVGLFAYEILKSGEESQGKIKEINNVRYYINESVKAAISMIDRTASTVTLEEDTTSIGNCAFKYCNNLTSITIPKGVTSIGEYAFSLCTNLSSITIPSSVTEIDGSAFGSCTNLTSVTIESDDIYVAANGIYYNQAGELLANAMTVKVLTTIVNTCDNSYLENTSYFTASQEGEYTVFTKVSA